MDAQDWCGQVRDLLDASSHLLKVANERPPGILLTWPLACQKIRSRWRGKSEHGSLAKTTLRAHKLRQTIAPKGDRALRQYPLMRRASRCLWEDRRGVSRIRLPISASYHHVSLVHATRQSSGEISFPSPGGFERVMLTDASS